MIRVPDFSEAFYVAGWSIDVTANHITKDNQSIRLEPKVMAVLVCLAKRSGEVISREELENIVWAGRVVGYDALGNAIIKLRKAFQDDARKPLIVETISKKGYRLIAEVQAFPEFDDYSGLTIFDQTPQRPVKPSVAVLAFDNFSSEPAQDYFSDGLSEDITTDLSKFPGLLVIARNSAFSYKGHSVPVKQMSEELGVQFVLVGSVRRSGQQLRINAQLIDAVSDTHVWADRFDREVDDVFDVQDEVRQQILGQIMPKLLSTEQNYHINRHINNVHAYDYFLNGREWALQDTDTALQRSTKLLSQALDEAPDFSSAWSHLGRVNTMNYINRWGKTTDRSIERGLEYGFRAVGLDEWNAHAHFSVAATALWMKQHDMALSSASRAIDIDPNFADGYASLGAIQMYSGDPEAAVKSLLKSLRVDPKFRDIYLHILAQAYFHMEDYENAMLVLKRRLIRKPNSDISHALLASCHGHLGNKQSGKAEWKQVLRSNPNYSVAHRCSILPYKNNEAVRQFSSGFEKLGIVA